MARAGGPAAISGFLYQILHHLGWLADIELTGQVAGQHVRHACLVLEPLDGGDARLESAGIHVVEQYKTRPKGTWSLTTIIEDVLSDLRQAVPESIHPAGLYRFVTDGRPGRLDSFRAFLAHLRAAAGPDDLDNENGQSFGDGFPTTHRGLFDTIVEKTRRVNERTRADERATVFHLLADFEMAFEVRAEERAEAVERLLRLYAPDLGDERRIRERLTGILLERLNRGETRTRADELLRWADLNPDRLRNLARLAEVTAAIATDRLRRMRYRPETDVRSAAGWPGDKPVLLISGGSGSGKTWQLGRLVTALGDARHLVVLETGKDTETILRRATRTVWQDGLGETNEKTPQALAAHYRDMAPHVALPWLTVAVDDVQDIEVARDLVRQDWARWGMRLALTVPTAVAHSLEMSDAETVQLHMLGSFTADEVDTLLQQRGRRWADLPADLKKLLRTPLLAGLYADLPHKSIQTAPSSEYEIFERYWDRIRHDRQQSAHPGDEGIVLALAGSVLDGKPYPWPRTAWSDADLDDAAFARLEAVGWLQRAEGGEAAFAHDRLLNWAVAEALAQRFWHKELSVEQLGSILVKCGMSSARHFGRPLRYVPMDLLWLLARDAQEAANVARLVQQLEESREYGSYGEDLYAHLLPTLGARAVPVLLARLDAIIVLGEGDYRIKSIGEGFVAIVRQEGVELTDEIRTLLHAPSHDRQAVAIAVLTSNGDACFLDRLWELHQERYAALSDREGKLSSLDYQASFAALGACVRLDPEWLRRRMMEADEECEPVSELAYLLNNLDHPRAAALWLDTKHVLVAKVRADKPRSLLYCIARFGDRSKLDFVLTSLGRRDDLAGSAALMALARLEPDMAIEQLVDASAQDHVFFHSWWLPTLLHVRPERTRQRLLEIARSRPDGRRLVEVLFSDHADDLDEPLLLFVLRSLETDLRARAEQGSAGDANWLFHPLRLLEGITRPDLLHVLSREAGGELECMITKVACGLIPHLTGHRDDVLEGARQVLIRIRGDGITELINRELEAEHFWGRYGGLKWAMVRPDATTIHRLAIIACRPVRMNDAGKPDSESIQDHFDATRTLAALGADEALVDAIWKSGAPHSSIELAALRPFDQPLAKTLTERALIVLAAKGSAGEAEMTCALTVAWLSADIDFIPKVRSVLARTDPNSQTAGLACIALRRLGDRSSEFAKLAARLLSTEKNKHWGVNALLSMGEAGRGPLMAHLQSTPTSAWGPTEERIIDGMYEHQSARATAIDAAVRYWQDRRPFDPPYEIAAEAERQDIREMILESAFSDDTFAPHGVLRAIKGLASFDPPRAVEAIEHGLRKQPKIERELCRLLVRLAPETAANILLDAAVTLDRPSLRAAVGRSLRRLDPSEIDLRLAELMRDPRREIRVVAAELACWLPPGRLTDSLNVLADRETEEPVRQAALGALARQRLESTVQALAAAFPSAPPDRRWVLLLAMLDAGDPFLLADRDDPIWLGHILTNAPHTYARHAEAALRERRQKIK
jgi:hypothetical protein